MKLAALTLAALCAGSFAAPEHFHQKHSARLTAGEALSEIDILRLYNDFRIHFRGEKESSSSLLQMATKFPAFRTEVRKILKHNANPKKTYTMGINKYSDWTWEEFSAYYHLNAPQQCSATEKGNHVRSGKPTSAHVDWTAVGVVSPVKNQASCGSCWTFSTSGTLESHIAILAGQRYDQGWNLDVSEQQLIDCAGDFKNNGCEGGLPSHAFEYIKHNGGITVDGSYPYIAKDLSCKYRDYMQRVLVDGSVNITRGDEDEMADAIEHYGPVALSYQVNDEFRSYSGGIFTSDNCGTTTMDVNHAVQAVGFGSNQAGLKYWKIKNSWGPDWGVEGYFMMERGANMCACAQCNSYPLFPTLA